uniref:protein shisa-4 isoform X1 n=1 Tax=Jaculus jaculus TaxID=51337 RepID=UPI001E1B06A3|nr:protein shisa-4 isoform X1 [Jaculus jaculus]
MARVVLQHPCRPPAGRPRLDTRPEEGRSGPAPPGLAHVLDIQRWHQRQGLRALAGEDCLWYLDRNGSWHPGFDCEFLTFCCGTCYQRYCCRDLTLLITERQQKHCLAFSPKTIAGIASAVILFVAVVATTICCFLCSCCYLYRRRQQLQSPFEVYRGRRVCLSVARDCTCAQT